MDALRRKDARVAPHPNLLGARQVAADGNGWLPFPLYGMRTENVERVRVFGLQNGFNLFEWRSCGSLQIFLSQHMQTILYEDGFERR